MWNSPKRENKQGKRYHAKDLEVLIYPIDFILDSYAILKPQEIFQESILQTLEKDEFILTVYELFQALLEDVAVPEKGHTGIQEAMISEFLTYTFEVLIDEVKHPDPDDDTQNLAWQSIERLLMNRDQDPAGIPRTLEEVGFTANETITYRSNRFTTEVWHDLILGEDGLWGEFLWDTDWRFTEIMDLPSDQAEALSEAMGINLDATHSLASTPSDASVEMAMSYIREIQGRLDS